MPFGNGYNNKVKSHHSLSKGFCHRPHNGRCRRCGRRFLLGPKAGKECRFGKHLSEFFHFGACFVLVLDKHLFRHYNDVAAFHHIAAVHDKVNRDGIMRHLFQTVL